MDLSIVIPVYNEEENIPLLGQALHQALENVPYSWEVILIDDGSKDRTIQALEMLASQDSEHMRVLELRRNFGQTSAIAAGIDYAQGTTIVLMDADLQNDPADIPLLIDKLNQGFDVVSGWRVDRQDAFWSRTLPSRTANWLISRVTGVHLHDYGCTLKAYRREVITGFRLYGEMHRFIPAYARSVGARIIEMPVRHHPRRHGKTKYGISRTLRVLLDLLTVKFLISYAQKPIYVFGGLGLAMFTLGIAALIFLLVRRLTVGTSVVQSPFFATGLMLMLMGIQSVLMGLIAELLARTYHESQKKTTYTVRRAINFLPK